VRQLLELQAQINPNATVQKERLAEFEHFPLVEKFALVVALIIQNQGNLDHNHFL
jgi:hypothetical protein